MRAGAFFKIETGNDFIAKPAVVDAMGATQGMSGARARKYAKGDQPEDETGSAAAWRERPATPPR